MILKYIYFIFCVLLKKGKVTEGCGKPSSPYSTSIPTSRASQQLFQAATSPPAPPPRASAKTQLTQVLLSLQTALGEKTQGTT